jgi:cytochrome P450
MLPMPATPLPPGPRGHFLTGNLAEFRSDRLGLFLRCARDYGDIVPVRLALIRGVVLSHPDAIESVLVTNSRNFTKHFALHRNRLILGNGLLTSEGDFWLRQRRLVQPAFTRSYLAGYGADMVSAAERLVAEWRDGDTRDLHTEMTRLTLGIAAKTLFGAEVGTEADDVGQALAAALAAFDARLGTWYLVPHWVPTASNRRLHRAVRRLDEVIYGFIERRRRSGEERGDLLSILLHARDEDGSRMTDQQLRDEAMTLFLAGHETTALVLAWTGYLLAQHPDAADRLHAEVRSVLGDRPPSVADLPRLATAERVVLESMRLYPPVYAFGREARADCEILGYRIPAGTTLFMSQWVMHRDPRWFDEPEKFLPERWAGGLAQRLPKFAYFPFGGGPRLCIGNTFAMMEAILVLATLARKFRLTLVPGHPVVPWPSMTLRPKHGIRVVLHQV